MRNNNYKIQINSIELINSFIKNLENEIKLLKKKILILQTYNY